MNNRFLSLAFAAFTVASASAASHYAPSQISVDRPLHIPGALLAPGSYSVQLEDRMYDRAIVKITGPNDKQYLIVSVPNKKLAAFGKSHLILDNDYARGFVCPGCGSPLEFAYPKDEAVTLAKATSKPVLAIDPESDKLPAAGSLTATDMKVVNLWMLTPSRVTPDADVQIAAAHYQAPATVVADNTAPAADAVPAPSASQSARKMPATASNDYNFAAFGFLALAAAFGIRAYRKRAVI